MFYIYLYIIIIIIIRSWLEQLILLGYDFGGLSKN